VSPYVSLSATSATSATKACRLFCNTPYGLTLVCVLLFPKKHGLKKSATKKTGKKLSIYIYISLSFFSPKLDRVPVMLTKTTMNFRKYIF
jgi:hypothetical protein